MNKFPEKIIIGYKEYTVEEWEHRTKRGSEYVGFHRGDGCIISVDTTTNNTEISNTLLHEILHAIYDFMGLDNSNEEKNVTLLANGLTLLMKNNPLLFPYLNDLVLEEKDTHTDS